MLQRKLQYTVLNFDDDYAEQNKNLDDIERLCWRQLFCCLWYYYEVASRIVLPLCNPDLPMIVADFGFRRRVLPSLI